MSEQTEIAELKATVAEFVRVLTKLELNLTEAQAIIRGLYPHTATLFDGPLQEARSLLAKVKL